MKGILVEMASKRALPSDISGGGGANERGDSLLGTLFESFFFMLFKMTLLRLRMSFWGLWASILVHFEVLFLSF